MRTIRIEHRIEAGEVYCEGCRFLNIYHSYYYCEEFAVDLCLTIDIPKRSRACLDAEVKAGE